MKYEVLPGRSVVTDKTYIPGESVELSDKDAKRLQKRGVVGEVVEEEGKTESTRPLNVTETVKLIEAAESPADLDRFAKDERKGVLTALEKRTQELLDSSSANSSGSETTNE